MGRQFTFPGFGVTDWTMGIITLNYPPVELSLFIKYPETPNCFSTAKLLDAHIGSGTQLLLLISEASKSY